MAYITTSGGQFIYKGSRFRFIGINQPYFNVNSYSASSMNQYFRLARDRGISVFRTWCFDAGKPPSNSDGNFRYLSGGSLAWREATLVHLDTLLDEARKQGIKLILCLADNTPNYDTKATYISWANSIYSAGLSQYNGGTTNPSIEFYTSSYTQQLFKDFILGLVTRVNTINGRTYSNDDTIMAWELGNEMRTDCFEGATVNTVNSTNLTLLCKTGGWMDVMSTYIKSLDSNHLVGCSSGSHAWEYVTSGGNEDWVFNGSFPGDDYRFIAALPNIDFLDCHHYPTQGLGEADIHNYGFKFGYTRATRGQGYRRQIKDWIDVAKSNNKPFVMGEVGIDRGVTPSNPDASNAIFPIYPAYNFFNEHFKVIFEDNDGDGIMLWSATTGGGGTYSIGLGEIGKDDYWGSNENSNYAELLHRINWLNTKLISPGHRPRIT